MAADLPHEPWRGPRPEVDPKVAKLPHLLGGVHLLDVQTGGMPCAFCDLIETGEARWVAADDVDVVAFLPLPDSELAPGHTLVVTRRHVVGVIDASETQVTAVAAMVRRISLAMVSALGATGVVVLNASGPNSGQTLAHLHFHVVPRWDDDDKTLPWLRQRSTRQLPGRPEELLAAAFAAQE